MYILQKHLDGKGIQVFDILLNVHADVRVGLQEGWQILGLNYQLQFVCVFVNYRTDHMERTMCTCVASKCESLVG